MGAIPIAESTSPAAITSKDCRRLHRKILADRHPPDPFLTDVARRFPSHAFLGNATQGVYLRQMRFLREFCERYFLLPPSELRVLDWGCGKGHISYLLRKEGFQTTSCDRKWVLGDSAFGQETPILDSQEIPVVPLEDDVRLPFGDGAFHVAVSAGVLEHVPRDADSLRELRRILRPGGVLFVSFLPYYRSWTQGVARWRGDDYHERLYSERKVRSLAERAEWRVLDLWHGQLFPKNSARYPDPDRFEALDRFLTDFTVLRYFATNLEAVLLSS
jgi:SAM-dependent methyltransferase